MGLDGFAGKSVAIQGLPAIERLLFGDNLADKFVGDPVRCPLLGAITANLRKVSGEVSGEWRDPETGYRFAIAIATAGAGNAYYLDDREATLDLYKSLHGGIEMILRLRLARPLGSSLDKARSKSAESWRSRRSLRNIKMSLNGLESLYEGGFSNFITAQPDVSALDAKIRMGFEAAQESLPIGSPKLAEAVTDPSARAALDKAAATIDALGELVARDLSAALGVQIGFNALDGD